METSVHCLRAPTQKRAATFQHRAAAYQQYLRARGVRARRASQQAAGRAAARAPFQPFHGELCVRVASRVEASGTWPTNKVRNGLVALRARARVCLCLYVCASFEMDEELLGDSLPCLRELENKVGRKTPPSLLLWMRDAAERQDAARNSDAAGDCGFAPDRDLSDKIRMLRREMVKSGCFVLPFCGLPCSSFLDACGSSFQPVQLVSALTATSRCLSLCFCFFRFYLKCQCILCNPA